MMIEPLIVPLSCNVCVPAKVKVEESPETSKIAPLATSMLVDARVPLPLRDSVPWPIAIEPVKVLVPWSVHVPLPD